ncbi:hypothetical protein SA3102_SA3102_02676 [Staphylococcus aureus]|nr:hypothetical protein SA3102_SA3102_02676 [Staphylococcus aureus]
MGFKLILKWFKETISLQMIGESNLSQYPFPLVS